MSIVVYFVHVDADQLRILHDQPAVVWNMASDPRFAKAAMVDIDKDWEVVSWLASDTRRKEQQASIVSRTASRRPEAKSLRGTDPAYQALLAEEAGKLGVTLVDTHVLPTDPLLEAIEGRGSESQRDPAIEFGLGPARVFSAAEVEALAHAFAAKPESELRSAFDRHEMQRFDVGGMEWEDEDADILDDILLPEFRKLRDFYRAAAEQGDHVLVIYQ